MEAASGSIDLRDYLRVIRGRRRTILLVAAVVTAAVVAMSLVAPKNYAGNAEVLIRSQDRGSAILGTPESDQSNHPERDLATQVQIAKSRGLLLAAIERLELQETPEELARRVDVAGVGDTNVITIQVTDRSPERAAAIANAIAEAFVAKSRDEKRASIKLAADQVQRRLEDSKRAVMALSKDPAMANSGQLQIATAAYTTLAQKLEELRVNEQLEAGDAGVSTPAFVDGRVVSPQPMRNGMLALVFGLIAGLGVAFVTEYLDNTVKTDEEAQQLYEAPVLGRIPFMKVDEGQRRCAITDDPGSRAAEGFRGLRNSLDFINFDHHIKTLMVTSCAPNEGKSTVAANLAASLAVAGQRVVLLNTDFRRPTLAKFFGLSNMIGLSDVLLGRSGVERALQGVDSPDLQLLTAGKLPPNPSELLGSVQMSQLIAELAEWADWIIVDTPPLLAVSDGAAVAKWADAVLMVSRGGRTTRAEARKGIEVLANVGVKPVGVVFTEPEAGVGGSSYGSYYGAYHSYYAYDEQGNDTGAEQKSTRRRKSGEPPAEGQSGEGGWKRWVAFISVIAVGAAVASVLLTR